MNLVGSRSRGLDMLVSNGFYEGLAHRRELEKDLILLMGTDARDGFFPTNGDNDSRYTRNTRRHDDRGLWNITILREAGDSLGDSPIHAPFRASRSGGRLWSVDGQELGMGLDCLCNDNWHRPRGAILRIRRFHTQDGSSHRPYSQFRNLDPLVSLEAPCQGLLSKEIPPTL